jgi:hypothetical protein
MADVERLKQMAEAVRQRALERQEAEDKRFGRELPGVDRDCPLTSVA